MSASLLLPIAHSDIPHIIALETASTDYPWSESALEQSYHAKHHCLVWQEEEILIGYCVLQHAADVVEILNIVVFSQHQGQGRGSRLLSAIIDYGQWQNAKEIWLEVRQSNGIAQKLYQNLGFMQTGRRKDYYRTKEGFEEAVLMRRVLPTTALQ